MSRWSPKSCPADDDDDNDKEESEWTLVKLMWSRVLLWSSYLLTWTWTIISKQTPPAVWWKQKLYTVYPPSALSDVYPCVVEKGISKRERMKEVYLPRKKETLVWMSLSETQNSCSVIKHDSIYKRIISNMIKYTYVILCHRPLIILFF